MHIGIFGVSGSGKTTIARRIASYHPDYVGISASKLISLYGGKIDLQLLNKETVKFNQELLISAYDAFKKCNKMSILEAHVVIETISGIETIHPSILERLHLDLAIYLYLPSATIYQQRLLDEKKQRLNISEMKIDELQKTSVDIIKHVFKERLIFINPNNFEPSELKL